MAKGTLLFMPDITGFTSFVKETELKHSEHIISELLEIIIDSNEMDLEVSEIEGDAILFYKEKTEADLDKIIKQAKKTFIDFHHHLKRYETDRICPCGACTTTNNLSLKMIIHFGDIGFINVKGTRKPHGNDVILIHRLLKNDIDETEYLLMSNITQFNFNGYFLNRADGLRSLNGKTTYDEYGEIAYQYIPLKTLKNQIPATVKHFPANYARQPIIYSGEINAPVSKVYEVVSNLDYRLSITDGIDQLKYDKDRVNRVGTLHTCLVNGRSLEFETVTADFGEDVLVYGEKIKSLPIVKEFTLYNVIHNSDRHTKIRYEVHYKPLPVIGFLLTPLFKKIFKKNLPKGFRALKEFCEGSIH